VLSDRDGSPASTRLWWSRWNEVLSDGLQRQADVGWLTGERGFLVVCRDLPRHDLAALRDDRDLDALLDDLDDRLIAFPGPLPSARARALIDVALAAEVTEVPDQARAALVPAGADPYDVEVRNQVDAMITDLRLWFGPGDPAAADRQVDVPIVVSHHARGDVVLLSMRCHPVRGVAPDVVRAPFQRVDAVFADAVERAVVATGVRAGGRYLLRSRRSGAPLDAIGGRSGGLGAALALRRVVDPTAAPLDPDWSFTGAVEADGSVTTLCGADGANEYRAKLSGLDRGSLVYPAADQTEVERLGETRAPGTRLQAVDTVGDAERLIARHIEGRRAYERALEPGGAVPKLAMVVLAALAIVAFTLWFQHHRRVAASQARRTEAAGEVLTIRSRYPDDVFEQFRINRFEVTNQQYRLCADAGECQWPDPDREQRSILDPWYDLLPVTGVTAADGVVFCQWAHGEGWSLPTFPQYGYALAALEHSVGAADTELTHELQTAIGGGPTDPDPYRLRGNVAEWTRSRCDPTGCSAEVEVTSSRSVALTAFGISFAQAQDPPADAEAWLTDPYLAATKRPSGSRSPDLGFRCASQS